ncbi:MULTISPECIES: MarR family winged helix-turn-helix transcriptional regulator [Sporosarcina]|uniref:MarR family winged helix-turn-helix transcriptional regulator n=1 Tax=Sporosarcina TaxID=1569 RepID=UPI00078D0975|nr:MULTISPECIES: SMC-Scp complex subunit ScpB [Sporosarcina]AMQ05697.1 MarR family transcriptional regulator [Sporosarcina psychrophila]QNK89625.1 SMC-Scp complex subunit ScpB [Sporosarcina sp. resist]
MDKKALFYKCVSFTTSVHRVTHELTKNTKSDSVTPVQYNILEYIAVSQPVTPSEISDCQHISMPNTSRELKKLSEKNLIEKSSDTEDRRKQYIRLSEDGETMMNESFACVEFRFLDRIQNASNEDLDAINQALDILQKKLFY